MTESIPPTEPEAQPTLTDEEKTLGIVVHLLPFVSAFIGPLVIYLLKKDSSQYLRQQSANVLNFQIFCALAYVVSFMLMFVFIGVILLPLVAIFWLVFIIIGTVKAAEGNVYQFPVTVPLLK